MYTEDSKKIKTLESVYKLTINQFDTEFEKFSKNFKIDIPVYVNPKIDESLIDGHEERKEERERMLSLRRADIVIETHQVVCNSDNIGDIVDRLVARGYEIGILSPNSFVVIARPTSDKKKKRKVSIFKLNFNKKK